MLLEAQNIENPLYERVKFLSIAGSNLDEFFMVRVAGLYSQIKQEVESLSSDGLTPDEQMNEVVIETKTLLNKQNKIYKNLISQLQKVKSAITLNDINIFKKPSKFSKPVVKAKTGRLLLVKKCEKSWCKIETGKYSGWVEVRNLWGRN